MSIHRMIADGTIERRARALLATLVLGAVALPAGCGQPEPAAGDPNASAGVEGEGLSLPEGYKPVDKPVEERKKVFEEAALHRFRALAEANAKLPMDDAHMPKGDKPAFDKRMADHRAILDPILAKGFAEIAQKHGITVEDVARIEDEANRLRWTPPPPPESAPAKKSAPAEEPAPAKEPAKS